MSYLYIFINVEIATPLLHFLPFLSEKNIWDKLLKAVRENLYDRDGQTERRHVDKYYVTWTTKGIRCYPKFTLSVEG